MRTGGDIGSAASRISLGSCWFSHSEAASSRSSGSSDCATSAISSAAEISGSAGRGRACSAARRPAAQRGDQGPARAVNRPEAGQQRHHRAERASACSRGAPHRREGHQVQVVGITKIIGLFQHRPPQLAARWHFPLVQDPQQGQREHQHPGDVVLLAGIGHRPAHGAQSREPRVEQRGIAGRPVSSAGPPVTTPSLICSRPAATAADHGPFSSGTSAAVTCRRHPDPDRSAGGRRTRLAQHLRRRDRPFPRPDPAGQRDRALEDGALAGQAGRLVKIVS